MLKCSSCAVLAYAVSLLMLLVLYWQAQESAEQWEKRAQQLQQKYGKVDLAEHQRVQEALAAVQTELAQLRTAAMAQQAQLLKELDQVCMCWTWWSVYVVCCVGVHK